MKCRPRIRVTATNLSIFVSACTLVPTQAVGGHNAEWTRRHVSLHIFLCIGKFMHLLNDDLIQNDERDIGHSHALPSDTCIYFTVKESRITFVISFKVWENPEHTNDVHIIRLACDDTHSDRVLGLYFYTGIFNQIEYNCVEVAPWVRHLLCAVHFRMWVTKV